MTKPDASRVREELDAFGRERAAHWANPPRGTCGREDCAEADAILHTAEDGTEVCAHCYRKQATRDRPYPCDHCGHEPAFRDPLGRRDEMFCLKCHEDNDYIPGDRAMVTKIASRTGVTHPQGRTVVCIAAGHGTECKGEKKQRGRRGILCNFHADPVKFNKNKGV